jgi:hypothetical protein
MNGKDKKEFEKKIEHIRVLLSYKVFPCPKEQCPSKTNTGFVLSGRCEFFHNDDDKRRFPFSQSPTFFHKNTILLNKIRENPSYGLPEFFSETAGADSRLKLAYVNIFQENGNNTNGCLNLEEFSYHPLTYKAFLCAEGPECQIKYCPRFHSSKEQEEFLRVRQFFEETENENTSGVRQAPEAKPTFLQTINDLLNDKKEIAKPTFLITREENSFVTSEIEGPNKRLDISDGKITNTDFSGFRLPIANPPIKAPQANAFPANLFYPKPRRDVQVIRALIRTRALRRTKLPQ